MHLESVRLIQYKNYKQAQVSFSPQVNCFLGENGSGKTNLLDAIFYLAFTKSADQALDMQCIFHNEDFFSIKGEFKVEEKKRVVLGAYQKGKKKQIKLDDKPYKKVSEHIGKFPTVLIAPNDTDVIRGASEDRRKFFDAIISQVDQGYLNNLIAYNHVLKQRNSLLKQFAEQDRFDSDLLEPFTEKLVELGTKVHEVRSRFIESFKPLLMEHYSKLSSEKELIGIEYESDFAEGIEGKMQSSLKKDLILKRTNKGIHKDEFVFIMDDVPVKKFGSQGQQKSYLIALKLANFDFLKNQLGVKPILLLDDIFDKLDDQRIEKLMQMVASDAFGQIFVTDARPERSISIFEKIDQEHKYFTVSQGVVEEISI
ncbi:DNA replication/repair protein RecF [uncultured Roseivirga sp.]|uniref:DNA replication/repair protein RecF n=1 Tax=uncultured Roseivirga sp. TaxID=543088 RepID=UPI000D7AC193|nr:DNA replication/repair protein RecF [uncultured Roseivirga sp.]PWL29885.1 MAG: DNA replication and repair protein RecF [Roseivirga sp. XM-24bin3]